MKKSVVVIGAGLGGLFAGAILAKEGLEVTVLEKNRTIGGGLQNFKRFGVTFDTGMHVIGGMREGGSILKICQYLGIADKVKLKHMDDQCAGTILFEEDNRTYRIGQGKNGFVDAMTEFIPEEKENVREYVDKMYEIADSVDIYNLRPANNTIFPSAIHELFLMPANQFIAQFVKNPKLRSALAYLNPFYGGRENQTPTYVHAIISTLYIDGASVFMGGSQHFANLLRDVIETHGGKVLEDQPVNWIQIDNRDVQYVETVHGNRFSADYCISAIHPCSMMKLMDDKVFTKAFRQRLEDAPNSYSAFSVFIKLKPNTFKLLNHSEYFMTKYEDVWSFGQLDKPWPLGFLFVTPCDSENQTFADKVIITAPMPFDMVKQWENTTVGKRGDDYLKWKQKMLEKLMEKVEILHHGFHQCVEAVNVASPLTIRDFYGVKDGSLYGLSKDCNNMAQSQLPVVTKVKNLLLTGQNNNLHGFCGVPLTAINTVEAIMGRNYIVNKINKA